MTKLYVKLFLLLCVCSVICKTTIIGRTSTAEGEVKKRKKEDEDDDTPTTSQSVEDEDTLKAHCAVIEKECKKKDGGKDYKIFRLLTATRDYRRKWMLAMNAPTRVITCLNAYPCLKKPLMVNKIINGCLSNIIIRH